jgi:DNA invertase Pin-like site-specific DNA recombinase
MVSEPSPFVFAAWSSAGASAEARHHDGRPRGAPHRDIVRTVRARGAVLKATEQPIDTGTAAGKCFLDMLGVFAEFETNLRRERQLEGIAKAKAAGVYKGRPPSIEASRVRELKAQGMRPVDIAKTLKIGRASVYRVLGTSAD